LKGKGLQEQVSQPENAAGRNNCNRAQTDT